MANDAIGGMLSVTVDDMAVLHATHMPFLTGGGIFIPTACGHALGDEVFVLLGLPGTPERIPVAGRVAWINPEGARGGTVPGIGVRFEDGDELARKRIEEILAGAGADIAEQRTYTM